MSLYFNRAPHHEGVLGEWRYNSTHSLTSALDVSLPCKSFTNILTIDAVGKALLNKLIEI
jgi:hypothetical protein